MVMPQLGRISDEQMHEHGLRLSDPVGAVGRLAFRRRIPPAVKVDDVRCLGQV